MCVQRITRGFPAKARTLKRFGTRSCFSTRYRRSYRISERKTPISHSPPVTEGMDMSCWASSNIIRTCNHAITEANQTYLVYCRRGSNLTGAARFSATSPLLARGGWTRHQEKYCEASFEGADGVVVHDQQKCF